MGNLIKFLCENKLTDSATISETEAIEQVKDAVSKLNSALDDAQKTNAKLEDEVKDLKNKLDEHRENRAKAAAEKAVKDGKIKAESKDKWEKLLADDYDSASALLAGIAEPKSPYGADPLPPNKGPQNTDGPNPYAKETVNYTAQARLEQEDPERAKQLQASAGVA